MDTAEWLTLSLHLAKYVADSPTICQTDSILLFRGFTVEAPFKGIVRPMKPERQKGEEWWLPHDNLQTGEIQNSSANLKIQICKSMTANFVFLSDGQS